jgi:transposase
VKTTERGGPHGYDAGKKVNGGIWHILVDTTGLVLKVVVHVASLQDREGVPLLLEPIKGVFPRMKKVWVDQVYTGKGREWIEQEMEWEVEVVRHPPRLRGIWVGPGMKITPEMLAVFERPRGFRHLPRRWVVERTFAWTTRFRRLVRDYERLPTTLAGLHLIVFACLMLHQWVSLRSTSGCSACACHSWTSRP